MNSDWFNNEYTTGCWQCHVFTGTASLHPVWHDLPCAWLIDTAGTTLTKDLGTHDWILVEIPFAVMFYLQLQTSHTFAHAKTAQLSRHVQNSDLIGSLFFKQALEDCFQALYHELIKYLWNGSQDTQLNAIFPYEFWFIHAVSPGLTHPGNYCFDLCRQMLFGNGPTPVWQSALIYNHCHLNSNRL